MSKEDGDRVLWVRIVDIVCGGRVGWDFGRLDLRYGRWLCFGEMCTLINRILLSSIMEMKLSYIVWYNFLATNTGVNL